MAKPKLPETKEVVEPVLDEIEAVAEQDVEIVETKDYEIEAVADSKHLRTGKIYNVSGSIAKVLLKQNLIKILK